MYLEVYGVAIVKFTLASWTVGSGGISAILQEVIIIDNDVAPCNLYETSIIGTTSPPSKR